MPLEIYRRGRIWHCRGTVGPASNRRRVRCSLNTADKTTATREAIALEKRYWDGHFDGPEAILTFAEAARRYRAAGKGDKFLAAIEKHLGETLVKDITEGSIQLMAKELYPNRTGASLNRSVIVPTQAVINHAAKSKLCSRIRVERYKAETKVKEPATLDWIKEFMAAAAPNLSAMALFMFLTGCRPDEAARLQWGDLDLQRAEALIRESKVAKERISNLPEMLVVALANLPQIKDRNVFLYPRAKAARCGWDGAVKRAGIKALTPHCCRHGFATGLLRRGVDVNTVAWLGGWASAAQVLKTYGHATKNPRLNNLLVDTQETHGTAYDSRNPLKTGTS